MPVTELMGMPKVVRVLMRAQPLDNGIRQRTCLISRPKI